MAGGKKISSVNVSKLLQVKSRSRKHFCIFLLVCIILPPTPHLLQFCYELNKNIRAFFVKNLTCLGKNKSEMNCWGHFPKGPRLHKFGILWYTTTDFRHGRRRKF